MAEAGRKRKPQTDAEELAYYRAQVMLRELVKDKRDYEAALESVEEQMRVHIRTLSIYIGAPKLSEILEISQSHASKILQEVAEEAGG